MSQSSRNVRKIPRWPRHLAWLALSLLLALLGTWAADHIPQAHAWKYVLGVVVFLVGTFLSLYYELNYQIIPKIEDSVDAASEEMKSKISLVDTYIQISRHSPQAAPEVFDVFLPCIRDLVKEDEHYWWFLNRELEKFKSVIRDWISKGCETNHSYLESLIRFTELSDEVLTTSVLPPSLWLRPEIGKPYFNKQATLVQQDKLHVHRVFLMAEGIDYDDEASNEVIKMHQDAGLDISFALVNSAEEFQDFVIVKNLGVVHSATLSTAMWEARNGKEPDVVWDGVKDKTARFYSAKHHESQRCKELFARLRLRDEVSPIAARTAWRGKKGDNDGTTRT